jgi:adenosylhomocysteine nucleosidase
MDDPCILFALRRESAAFRRAYRPRQTFTGAPCRAQFCGMAPGVLVAETGVGQTRVTHVLDWLLGKPTFEGAIYQPRFLVFAGFAGALSHDLHIGDIVLADEVIDASGHCRPTTLPANLPEGMVKRGRLLTVNELSATAQDKGKLAGQHRAIAVDMESAVFAERCSRAGIPFACVRAISDEAATSLSPALVSMLAGGAVSPWRVTLSILLRPSLLPELWRLARDTRKAAEHLANGLCELLVQHAAGSPPGETHL